MLENSDLSKKTFIDIFTLARYHVKIIVFMVLNHHVTPRTPFLDPWNMLKVRFLLWMMKLR